MLAAVGTELAALGSVGCVSTLAGEGFGARVSRGMRTTAPASRAQAKRPMDRLAPKSRSVVGRRIGAAAVAAGGGGVARRGRATTGDDDGGAGIVADATTEAAVTSGATATRSTPGGESGDDGGAATCRSLAGRGVRSSRSAAHVGGPLVGSFTVNGFAKGAPGDAFLHVEKSSPNGCAVGSLRDRARLITRIRVGLLTRGERTSSTGRARFGGRDTTDGGGGSGGARSGLGGRGSGGAGSTKRRGGGKCTRGGSSSFPSRRPGPASAAASPVVGVDTRALSEPPGITST